jgi:hypothetical protein
MCSSSSEVEMKKYIIAYLENPFIKMEIVDKGKANKICKNRRVINCLPIYMIK